MRIFKVFRFQITQKTGHKITTVWSRSSAARFTAATGGRRRWNVLRGTEQRWEGFILFFTSSYS